MAQGQSFEVHRESGDEVGEGRDLLVREGRARRGTGEYHDPLTTAIGEQWQEKTAG